MFQFIILAFETEQRALLPELVGAELVQKKKSDVSFLVQFGYHECAACQAANPGMQAEQEKQGYKIEVYFVDCHNSKNNCGQYNLKSFPSFYLFNYEGGKRLPLQYTDHDYSYDKIYEWALRNSRKPFKSFSSVDDLKMAMESSEEFILITTIDYDLDGSGYRFARDFRTANVLVLTEFDSSKSRQLDNTPVGDLLDDEEQQNVIYCKETCKLFSGTLENREAVSDFLL